ncbi:hypothetical protein CC79DRAFT_1364503 [Sarocladium strictum]
MASTSTPTPAHKASSIPFFYRLSLLHIEPIFALGGALILHFDPAAFLTTMTPSPTPDPSAFRSFRVLTDQLAAMQVLLAFNLGVLLRFAANMEDKRMGNKLWRLCCGGALVCDGLHIAASVRELGWEVASSPGTMWRAEDWVNFGILGWMTAVRVAVFLGIGMSDGTSSQQSERAVKDKTK